MFTIEDLHHVSVPVTDIERSRDFYENTLGLKEAEAPEQRPDFPFGGAWYDLGDHRQLHLIVNEAGMSTFRRGKKLDSRDTHFAVRVNDYGETRQHLISRGYQSGASDELKEMRETLTT
jgi:catechol 2,3-dioxygenase-like lactoylglutathione lyase family enzyme